MENTTENYKLNANGCQLYNGLTALSAESKQEYTGRYINVAGVGKIVSTAYEQLRNAAENAQENLLLRRAVRRFFIRELFLRVKDVDGKQVAEDLVVELTQAGYLKNNTQPIGVTSEIGDIINQHFNNYRRFIANGVPEKTAQSWSLDLLSLSCEKILLPDELQPLFVQFAYHHYQSTIQKKFFAKAGDSYEASLYVAVHRALIKSDIGAVRYDMQRIYQISDKNITEYINFHNNIDAIFSSETTNKLMRHINRYGASLRVLYSMMQENQKTGELLENEEQFERAYKTQIKKEYRRASKRLNKSLIKSIAFLLITKTLIGVAIEIPYDLLTIGVVLMVPLFVNLLTPVVFLILLRLGIHLPGDVNTTTIQGYAKDMLYGNGDEILYPFVKEKKYPIGFTIAYAVMFLVVFALVINLLILLKFSFVQGIIFFIFLAAASFLGYRLLRIVTELEIVVDKPNLFITIRDFIFMPFTALGKWMSEKYQRFNFVAMLLDVFIELPLKTVLKLIRQWTGFIDDKKEQI